MNSVKKHKNIAIDCAINAKNRPCYANSFILLLKQGVYDLR